MASALTWSYSLLQPSLHRLNSASAFPFLADWFRAHPLDNYAAGMSQAAIYSIYTGVISADDCRGMISSHLVQEKDVTHTTRMSCFISAQKIKPTLMDSCHKTHCRSNTNCHKMMHKEASISPHKFCKAGLKVIKPACSASELIIHAYQTAFNKSDTQVWLALYTSSIRYDLVSSLHVCWGSSMR